MSAPLHTRRIAVNGVTLNVVVEGTGPDVLLVHGFPDDHALWRHQIPALVKAGYRVIAPDTRGCGESAIAPRTSDYKLPTLVADLVALLDVLGIERVRLVGHDWGAAICWSLCMTHPERVDRYVALSVGHLTAYARGPLKQKLMGWYIAFFQLRGLAEWLLRAHDWWLARRVFGHPGQQAHWAAEKGRPGRLTAAINYYRANADLLLGRALPRVGVPVLGVWSSGDRFLCEQQMLDTARWVTGPWRYQRLDGPSHWMPLDAPEAVNDLLLGALR